MKDRQNSVITEIVSEYGRIEKKWLTLHYKTFNSLVLLGFAIECVIGMILNCSGYIEISMSKYIMKYLIAPFIINLCLILAGYWVMHYPGLKHNIKVYTVSLLCVGVCFVFNCIHSVFDSVFIIFTFPIILTVIYGDYILTTVTGAAAVAAKTIADLFIRWDPDKTHPFSNSFEKINFIISICILCTFYTTCIIVIRFERAKNTASIQKEIERYKMRRKLVTDELTQIYNRTALRNAFKDMEEDRLSNSYAFAMMDLDNFKLLNDTLGHQNGDECLREFGGILKKNCADAVSFRFGGDEFCVLFKNKTVDDIKRICLNIQTDLKKVHVVEPNALMTVSIGIARYKKHMSAAQLLENTDKALYKSKETKNNICVFDEDEKTLSE